MGEEDPQAKAVYEIWSMMVHILRTPSFPISLGSFQPFWSPSSSSLTQRRSHQISPAAFGLLFIGISMALMLFGIVSFVIGFVLMPVVIMLVMLFYFVRIVTKLSEIARSLLFWPVVTCSWEASS
ncbi:hypothetical protein OROGR_018399 [Orobanche gracilis]